MEFEIKNKDSKSNARTGILKTAHGMIETPAFIGCATKGVVKGMTFPELNEIGTQTIIVNAFHMYLRPGLKIIKNLGGLHKYIKWTKPIFTDSGGFQALSERFYSKIKEDGIEYKNPYDGQRYLITPEKSMEIQHDLGADIIMAFDECPRYGLDYEYYEKSLDYTIKWARICKTSHNSTDQTLIGIIQGGTFLDLRKKSVEEILEIDFPGYALGGLCVGEPRGLMYKVLDHTIPLLPKDKTIHLMGVGTPQDILEAVERGVDLFDSVFPTKTGGHGGCYTHRGLNRFDKLLYLNDTNPIDPDCSCFTCKNYSSSFVTHLYKDNEIVGKRLIIIHNLTFLMHLMKHIRNAINKGEFFEFKKAFLEKYLKEDKERS
ncbi:MAG: tRNA guanosine(34) transglycosylase Tgt [Promethearchaeota archaeon]